MQQGDKWVVYRNEWRTLSKKKEKMMKGRTVWFEYEEWKHNNLGRACLLIKQWHVRQLLIMKAQNHEMIRQISNINFPHLAYISLQQNNIESAESLCRVRFPVLRQLRLDENFITTIRTIRKMRCKHLMDLQINNNFITDAQSITDLKTSNEVKVLHLEQKWDHEMCSNIQWVVKLETLRLYELKIGSRKRISQDSFVRRIKQRFERVINVVRKPTE